MPFKLYLTCLRPQQWVKNLIIFAAPFTAGSPLKFTDLKQLAVVFIFFCAASSTNYVLNDWLDRNFDAQHNQKRNRPFAAQKIGYKSLIFLLLSLIFFQIVLSFLIPIFVSLWILIYLVSSISYSMYFKNIPVIEMLFVAIGYLFRALAGAAAIKVEASSWFLIVIGFGALFLIATKRLAEINYQEAPFTRKVGDQYSKVFLETVIGSSMTICLIGYTLWAFQYSNGNTFSKLSVIILTTAIIRYLWTTGQKNTERPEAVLFSDKTFLTLGAIFLVLISGAIYV
jgi:decaprenyl-phosphate phosphoribosyltransferase